ncbi:MAG: preprotein translocase subunit SecA [Firmicutes bacterium]|nr:preprotein translocase subunit SecA [Bacillota bacterium]
MLGLLKKAFDPNQKEIKRLSETCAAVNVLESDMQARSDSGLAVCSQELRERVVNGASLDEVLPEAFALAREASRRTLGMRPFDVQVMGAVALHEGRIAEMKTGEGKTLVATMPVYLNALSGRGVHVVTVNEYLANRDAEWMGAVYKFLGLSVGVILHDMSHEERRAAYGCDVTYGTNNEFGFDYLRDNMAWDGGQLVQRGLNYAIVDEVDSILIDEARTPLIISGQAEESTDHYYKFAKIVPRLQATEDYTVDEKARSVALTEEGVAKVERWLGVSNLYDDSHFELTHYLNQALKAQTLFRRDRDYVVKEGQVIIVDEFTGRLMFGRRYSDGLHQAIEAKEGVKIERESQTLASITFQNFFRMYDKLAGMTGTAVTEEAEFRKIYGLYVVSIPTAKPMIRKDYDDLVYKTERAKFESVVLEICDLYEKQRPVLVGTTSIEKSERLSDLLRTRGIPHQVLNAKHHEKEAEIIKSAGQNGAVTIATNMAGRGTDIVLGEGVVELGGLHIIGTERHESRRIDNQLRGRSGRQGDPGSSQFYVSLEDDLMRLFGSSRIASIMERLGWKDDQPIVHGQISRAIETAQKKVEAHNFEIRKQVLEYDDVMNKQREVIYEQRRRILMGQDLRSALIEMEGRVVDDLLGPYMDPKIHPEDWDLEGLAERWSELVNRPGGVEPSELADIKPDEIRGFLVQRAEDVYREREEELGSPEMRSIERIVLLRIVDSKWMEHLRMMDDLREGIGLRAYGQKDPLLEYRFEAYNVFQSMVNSIQEEAVRLMFRVRLVSQEQSAAEARVRNVVTNRDADGSVREKAGVAQRKVEAKVGRNEPCPCGSGRKYKRCCGQKAV